MSSEQLHREISHIYDHDIYNMPASTTMTWHMGSGTDTDTDRYFNLPCGVSYGIKIISEASVSITEINDKPLKAPLPVSTGGFTTDKLRISSIKISNETTARTVQVEVKC